MKNANILHLANLLTLSRIAVSVALLFCRPFAPLFWIFYAWCGLSDMIDGPIARKTGNATPFGAKLDSIADLLFVAVCLVRLLPVFNIPTWLWTWIIVIFCIKIINIVSGFVCWKKLVLPHTTANKVSGFLLFLLPIAYEFVGLKYPAFLICIVISFAAIQEGHLIRVKKDFEN